MGEVEKIIIYTMIFFICFILGNLLNYVIAIRVSKKTTPEYEELLGAIYNDTKFHDINIVEQGKGCRVYTRTYYSPQPQLNEQEVENILKSKEEIQNNVRNYHKKRTANQYDKYKILTAKHEMENNYYQKK